MFIVLEIQTNANGTVGTLINSYEDQSQAASAYHTVLASAAVSSIPVHSCAMLTEEGFCVKRECYKHETNNVSETEQAAE